MKKKQKTSTREITVFIASPGDLAPERKVFNDTINALNQGFGDGVGVKFTALGWENVLAETGRRVQSVINRQIQQCDIFVLALNRRWGQEAPESKATSYTEEEFQLAFSLWKKKKSPEILIFFKAVDSQALADPGPQLQKVMAFRKSLEDGHMTWPRRFNTDIDFGLEIDRHLRDYVKGGWQDLSRESSSIRFSHKAIEDLNVAKRRGTKRTKKKTEGKETAVLRQQAIADLTQVKLNQKDLTMARAAMDAAKAGRTEDASILFAQATESTTDLSILSAAAEYFLKIGDLDSATRLKQRQVSIAKDVTIAAQYYMDLVPPDTLLTSRDQMIQQILSAREPGAETEELKSIILEAFSLEALTGITLEALVHHCTESEILEQARFLASPAGQSFIRKQPLMLLESMQRGGEIMRETLMKRYPELRDEEASSPILLEEDSPAQVLSLP